MITNKFITLLLLCYCITYNVYSQFNLDSIDTIVKNAVTNETFEGSILIADQGEIIYHNSFGHKDIKKSIPIENNNTFSIASITKMLTAILVLQQVEEAKYSLSNNLKQLLPELKIPKGHKITVHHLLLHISGLPNEKDRIYRKSVTPEQFVKETLEKGTIIEKGPKFGSFNYANIDYVLLGLILEKFSGQSWESLMQEQILDKLGMDNTGFLARDNYPENFVPTFSFDANDNRLKDPQFHIENFYAAGCMYSTASDLLKLDQAMYGEQLLTDVSKTLMFTSYPQYNYTGYSVWTYNYPFADSKPRIMERRGGIMGANLALIRMLDSNKTIIILSNNDKFQPDTFGQTNTLRESLMIEVAK